ARRERSLVALGAVQEVVLRETRLERVLLEHPHEEDRPGARQGGRGVEPSLEVPQAPALAEAVVGGHVPPLDPEECERELAPLGQRARKRRVEVLQALSCEARLDAAPC